MSSINSPFKSIFLSGFKPKLLPHTGVFWTGRRFICCWVFHGTVLVLFLGPLDSKNLLISAVLSFARVWASEQFDHRHKSPWQHRLGHQRRLDRQEPKEKMSVANVIIFYYLENNCILFVFLLFSLHFWRPPSAPYRSRSGLQPWNLTYTDIQPLFF